MWSFVSNEPNARNHLHDGPVNSKGYRLAGKRPCKCAPCSIQPAHDSANRDFQRVGHFIYFTSHAKQGVCAGYSQQTTEFTTFYRGEKPGNANVRVNGMPSDPYDVSGWCVSPPRILSSAPEFACTDRPLQTGVSGRGTRFGAGPQVRRGLIQTTRSRVGRGQPT